MTRRAENGGKAGKSNSRSERLAAALRENLRRRKAQERARAERPEAARENEPGPDKPR